MLFLVRDNLLIEGPLMTSLFFCPSLVSIGHLKPTIINLLTYLVPLDILVAYHRYVLVQRSKADIHYSRCSLMYGVTSKTPRRCLKPQLVPNPILYDFFVNMHAYDNV